MSVCKQLPREPVAAGGETEVPVPCAVTRATVHCDAMGLDLKLKITHPNCICYAYFPPSKEREVRKENAGANDCRSLAFIVQALHPRYCRECRKELRLDDDLAKNISERGHGVATLTGMEISCTIA